MAFIALCAIYLQLRGIRIAGDSPRYTDGAQRLIHGLPLDGKQKSYPGYIAVVALTQLTGLDLTGVIALQILVAIVAAFSLYRLGVALGSPSVGLLAAALFLLNPEIMRWHTYILTDSLYVSGVVLATHAIYAAALRPTSGRTILALGAIAFCMSLRPNGWILVPVAVTFWLFLSPVPTSRSRKALVILLPLLLLPLLPGLRTSVAEEAPTTMLRQGTVIWGYDAANLKMPVDSHPLTGRWTDGPQYALAHPLPTLRLGATRVAAELLHARPYYSLLHNLVILTYLLPTYLLAAMAFLVNRRHPLVQLIALVIVGHFLVVAMTFADWDGRFLLYALPVVQLLAAWSIIRLAELVPLRIRQSKHGEPQSP